MVFYLTVSDCIGEAINITRAEDIQVERAIANLTQSLGINETTAAFILGAMTAYKIENLCEQENSDSPLLTNKKSKNYYISSKCFVIEDGKVLLDIEDLINMQRKVRDGSRITNPKLITALIRFACGLDTPYDGNGVDYPNELYCSYSVSLPESQTNQFIERLIKPNSTFTKDEIKFIKENREILACRLFYIDGYCINQQPAHIILNGLNRLRNIEIEEQTLKE